MVFFLILAVTLHSKAYAVEVTPSPTAPVADTAQENGSEYEIDYEEEADAGEEEAPEAVKQPEKTKKTPQSLKIGVGPAVQGSRAKNRFIPILKSDTRSVYQREGKSYDVDTD